MNNTFTVGGVSRQKGTVKVRFANDMTRVKMMAKDGQTDINLMELPRAMEKGEVVKFLLTTSLFDNPEFAEAIEDADAKYNSPPKAAKVAKASKAAKPAVVKAKKTSKPKVTEPATPAEKLEKLKTRAKAKVAA